MRQTTKFYAVLLCAALGFSTSIQSCKDYDDDIDSLNERIDAVNKSLEDLKKDFGALAYVKDVKWDESTRTLTITPVTGNPVTYTIADANTQDGNTKYTLASNQEGNKITITLKGDDNSEQKVEFELPSAETITKDDITLDDNGYICVKDQPTNVKMPQDFDFTKMEVENREGVLYLKYDNQEIKLLTINEFDPTALTFVSENGKIVVKYLGTPTGQTIELPAATAIIEKEDGSGFIVKVGDKQVDIVNLNILKAELKSLVFIPEVYYQGIEAMYANTFYYTPLTLKAVDANSVDGDKDAPVEGKEEFSVTPTLKAQYHLNPSNAKVSKENLSFIFGNKPYTKAGEMEVKILKAETADGILTVYAGLANGTIKDITKDEEVSTLALQAITATGEKDTTIISDYAAIKALAAKGFALSVPGDPDMIYDVHHYTTAAEALATDARYYPLVWNDEDGIDVAELVQTHAGINTTIYFHQILDVNASTDEIKAYGFKYNYELVGYLAGDNKTSQSAHAAMKGSILRAQTTENGSQQGFGAEQNRSTIGRMPLVRVSLIDTASNNVAAVAYLKFKITEEEEVAPVDEVLHVANFTFDKDYTVGCTPDYYNFPLDWVKVEEGIYTALNMSKKEFEGEFKLEFYADPNLEQFTNTTINAQKVTKRVGIASRKQDNIGDETTDVLAWQVSQAEAYNIFSAGATKATIIVRFVRENANNTKHYVYVTLNWQPAKLNVEPAGTILDDANTKFTSAWFAEDKGTPGFDEVHFNVEVPKEGATCKFEKNILDVFVGQKVLISQVNETTYPSFKANNLVKEFVFVTPDETVVSGSDNKNYKLSVSTDGLTLSATLLDQNGNETTTKAAVAVLSTTENADAANNFVTYQNNEIAKAVLNHAGHLALGKNETLTAKVQVNVVNGCDQKLDVTNNTFDVKFLRPISIEATNGSLKDAEDDGSKLALNKAMQFVDWRGFEFVPDNMNYFEYYGVTAIAINVNDIMLDGKKLKDKYPAAEVEYKDVTTDKIKTGDFGTIIWHNNGSSLSADITIEVPVEVTYKWGTFKFDVPVVVKKTIGQ